MAGPIMPARPGAQRRGPLGARAPPLGADGVAVVG